MSGAPLIPSEELLGDRSSYSTESDEFTDPWDVDLAAALGEVSSLDGSVGCQSILGGCHRDQVSSVFLLVDKYPHEESVMSAYLPLIPHRELSDFRPECFTVSPGAMRYITADDGLVEPDTPLGCPILNSMLPQEIFDIILTDLSRDDASSMRLVCRKFRDNVSPAFFDTTVVPFNTQLYGQTDDPDTDLGPGIFEEIGQYIKQFGMTFEVEEDQLACPPPKLKRQNESSYHGHYRWPTSEYLRFAELADIEKTAGETQRMKRAFSNLEKVRELAISVDNGLGWLNVAERSIRALVFQSPSRIFKSSDEWLHNTDRKRAADFWEALESGHAASMNDHALEELLFARRYLSEPPWYSRFRGPQTWPLIRTKTTSPCIAEYGDADECGTGVLYTTHELPAIGGLYHRAGKLVPKSLTEDQLEWLLETRWAQEAFLQCYTLAVIDNRAVFSNVTSFNCSTISCGFLTILVQLGLWKALPALANLTILVKPEWRTISQSSSRITSESILPSQAVSIFRDILREHICGLSKVSKLKIGWVGGGEHAEGILARNSHILPAPLTRLEDSLSSEPDTLRFPHLKHLTLYNCWLSPPTLSCITAHTEYNVLETLVLDSVSLPAHYGNPPDLSTVPYTWVSPVTGIASQYVVTPTHPRPEREGPWPPLLSSIFPAHHPKPSHHSDARPGRPSRPRPPHSSLGTLELNSCGYICLRNLSERAFHPYSDLYSPWFLRRREDVIETAMDGTADHYLGSIRQSLSEREEAVLRGTWGLRCGVWEDVEAQRGPMFDGLEPGGTGRFSGKIRRKEGEEG